MRRKLIKLAAGLAALAALALGGATLASATQHATPTVQSQPGAQQTGPNDQQATGPATATGTTTTTTTTTGPTATTTGTPPTATGQASTEQVESATETGGAESAEVAGGDGPGGHADEPANPNAEHQFDGVE